MDMGTGLIPSAPFGGRGGGPPGYCGIGRLLAGGPGCCPLPQSSGGRGKGGGGVGAEVDRVP
jgi:hypothetical protein